MEELSVASRRMTVPGGRDMRHLQVPRTRCRQDSGGSTGYRSGTGRYRRHRVTVAASCSNGHSAFAKWHVHLGFSALRYLIRPSGSQRYRKLKPRHPLRPKHLRHRRRQELNCGNSRDRGGDEIEIRFRVLVLPSANGPILSSLFFFLPVHNVRGCVL